MTTIGQQETFNSRCPQCGGSFDCGIKSGRGTCWCFSLPTVLPAVGRKQCLCPDCLGRLAGTVDNKTAEGNGPE